MRQSLAAVHGIDRRARGGSIPNRESASCDADLDAARIERKRNSDGNWHVSRLSVFTEIPCTLRPITFVTDYSTKVSHRARGRKLTPINYTARIVNAVKWSPRRARDSSNSERAALADPTITPKRLNLSLRISYLS